MCGLKLEAEPGDASTVAADMVPGVVLPPGRALNERVWISDAPDVNVYRYWARLAAMFESTGLWPVVLVHPELLEADIPVPEHLGSDSAAVVLERWWDRWLSVERSEHDGWAESESPLRFADEPIEAYLESIGLAFPGLAPLQQECQVTAEVWGTALAPQPVALSHLGLIAVSRPADIFAVLDLDGLYGLVDMRELATVVESWGERLGAAPVEINKDGFSLYLERPPRTMEDYRLWTAERVALGDETFLDLERFSSFDDFAKHQFEVDLQRGQHHGFIWM